MLASDRTGGRAAVVVDVAVGAGVGCEPGASELVAGVSVATVAAVSFAGVEATGGAESCAQAADIKTMTTAILRFMRRSLLLIPVLFTTLAFGDEAPGAALYRAKMCSGCHAADGSGNTPVGKAVGARDLRSPEVQQQSDDQLAATISSGKGKMPAYKASLSADQLKQLVAFIRELAKKQ